MVGIGHGRVTRLVAGVCLIGLAISPATVRAEGSREDYKDALRAVEEQDWQTAIELLHRAIAADPKAKAGAFKRYVPHYYLGLSFFELGSCKAALTVWAESHKQGVIKKLKEYGTLQQGVVVCQKRITRQETTGNLAEITGFAAALRELRDQPEVKGAWDSGSPSWQERFVSAEQMLAAAQQILDRSDSQVSLQELKEANDQVIAAARQLEVIQSEARNKFKETRAKIDVRSRLIDMQLEETRKVLASVAYLRPFPPRINEFHAEVERLVAAAGATDKTTHPDDLDDLRLRLSKALERLRQACVPPPQTLVGAAEAFLSADHEQVLEILAGKQFPAGRQAAQAHLFRAASLYSLWVASDEQEDGTRVEAGIEVRSCREEDIALIPLDKAFSPRFVAFFFSEGKVRAPIPQD